MPGLDGPRQSRTANSSKELHNYRHSWAPLKLSRRRALRRIVPFHEIHVRVMNANRPDGQSEGQDQADVNRRLAEALAEITRLRSENARLKSVLETFSLRKASDLTHASRGRPGPPSKEDAIRTVTSGTEGAAKEPLTADSTALSPDKKVRLFRSLFRGREDVYAVRAGGKHHCHLLGG